MRLSRTTSLAGATLVAVLAAACQSSPTAPAPDFGNAGARVAGTFAGDGGSAAGLQASATTRYQGIVVFARQAPSVRAEVRSNGTFVLAGLPAGTLTLVFERDGKTLGAITLLDVLANEEVRVVVALTETDQVVLVSESRDRAGDLGGCPRSPGFWCQNRGGQNPNLSREEFEELAKKAANRVFDSAPEDPVRAVETAVCDTSDQLLRQLVALALNLEARLVDDTTTLVGGDPYDTVGAAFDAGLDALAETDRDKRNEVKDVLEDINEGTAIEGCAGEADEGNEEGEEPVSNECSTPDPDGKITICHYPPGNPDKPQTIRIAPSALPAHQAHGDTCGACS